MVGGIPATRRGHLKSSPFMPDHSIAATVHASILLCSPATVAVHVGGAAMVMHIIPVLPVLCRCMLHIHCMNGLGCTCT